MQAVKRNLDRFPEDFMFQLTDAENKFLKSQIVISSWGGARRATPYAFTEQGVAMLSSVLNSKRAVQVNIAIMRAFVRLRELLSTQKDVAHKLEEMERTQKEHGVHINAIWKAIQKLIEPLDRPNITSTHSQATRYRVRLGLGFPPSREFGILVDKRTAPCLTTPYTKQPTWLGTSDYSLNAGLVVRFPMMRPSA